MWEEILSKIFEWGACIGIYCGDITDITDADKPRISDTMQDHHHLQWIDLYIILGHIRVLGRSIRFVTLLKDLTTENKSM